MQRIPGDLRPDSMKSSAISVEVREIPIRPLVYSMYTDHREPQNAHLKSKLNIHFPQIIRIHHEKRSYAQKKRYSNTMSNLRKKYNYGSYRDHLKNKHPNHDFANLATLAETKDTSVKKQVRSVSFETPFSHGSLSTIYIY